MGLYIPIWTYSNSAFFHAMNEPSSFTFQSGHILIKYPVPFTLFTKLYIPIWTYSNAIVFVKINIFYFLYIPIWTYSNPNRHPPIACTSFFTFQSGHILMKTIRHASLCMCPLHSNLDIF